MFGKGPGQNTIGRIGTTEMRTDQIYKIIREKLAEFDEQVQSAIEEAEGRMRTNLKTTVELQKERLDVMQAQLDKLGEEIAFDINKVYKTAKHAQVQVTQLLENNAYTNNLIA